MTKIDWLELAKGHMQSDPEYATKCINEVIELIKIEELDQAIRKVGMDKIWWHGWWAATITLTIVNSLFKFMGW